MPFLQSGHAVVSQAFAQHAAGRVSASVLEHVIFE